MATEKILQWSVGLADANRRRAAAPSEGIARSVKGGDALNDKIGYLTKKLPLTREELSATAKTLARMQAYAATYNLRPRCSARPSSQRELKFGPNFQAEMLSLDRAEQGFLGKP